MWERIIPLGELQLAFHLIVQCYFTRRTSFALRANSAHISFLMYIKSDGDWDGPIDVVHDYTDNTKMGKTWLWGRMNRPTLALLQKVDI